MTIIAEQIKLVRILGILSNPFIVLNKFRFAFRGTLELKFTSSTSSTTGKALNMHLDKLNRFSLISRIFSKLILKGFMF